MCILRKFLKKKNEKSKPKCEDWFNNPEKRKVSRFNPYPEGDGFVGNRLDANSIKKNGV